ncbi:MAG: hypothetical protein HY934_03915 [Candidatus Firestonebacteria bacterium]|nr:hypothetical protein [Candidatus Firestonebacteria bacterium]
MKKNLIKKYYQEIINFVIILYLLSFMGCASKTISVKASRDLSNKLVKQLNNPHILKEEKKSIIQQLGDTKDVSVIPELNKIITNNNESELWMETAYSLEKLGVKDAIEAQKEYEKIRGYEKDYYYLKVTQDSSKESQYEKIVRSFEQWLSKFPDHPKAPNIETSIKYFRKIIEDITLQKVYSDPKKYLSKKVQWQGIIKEIDMQENKVKLSIFTGNLKWIALLDASKFIPEIHKVNDNIKIEGDIIEYIKDSSLDIPVVYIKKIW